MRNVVKFAALLLSAVSAYPCTVATTKKLWAKRPGSESKLFAFERNGRVGFIDQTGRILIQPTVDATVDSIGDFSNGLARVANRGYIDGAGKWVIKKEFNWTKDFSDGLAQIFVTDPYLKYNEIGFLIDPKGSVVGNLSSSRTGEISEGFISFEAKGKAGLRKSELGNFVYRDFPGLKGFLNRNGDIAIPPKFADVGPFRHGLARAVLDGYCHIATPRNSWEGTPTTGYPSSCGGAPEDALTTCMTGFVNSTGQFVIEPQFEAAQDFHETLAAVRIAERWGFVDSNGALVIATRFEQVQSFAEGLAGVKVNGKWGFIDQTGRLLIQPMFEDVEPFSDSLAVAYEKGLAFFIDRTGRTRIRGPFLEVTSFVNGLAAVRRSATQAEYINHSGKPVFRFALK